MKIKKYIIILILIIPLNVKANIMCNDGTTSPTCTDCHRGCCSHHGGCASGGNSNYYSNNNYSNNNSSNNEAPPVISKSSDTSLKEVRIDGKPIEISDNMNVSLSQKTATIYATANDSKAIVENKKYIDLLNGINNYKIKVTAEDGNIKEYTITINNRILSNNKNFKIYYNNKKLNINKYNNTIETITVKNNIKKINFKTILEDKNSKIKFTGNKKLKFGENTIKITITAEDKSKITYKMKVKKNFF